MYFDKELGEIKLIANAKAKRVIVRYKDGQFYLTHPVFISQKEIKNSVEEMKPRLLALKEHKVSEFIFTEETKFSTLTFDLEIKSNTLKNIYTKLNDGILTLYYPQTIVLSDKNMQGHIKNIVESYCRAEANRIFPDRTRQLARQHNFEVKDIKINKSRGRWGSCSTKKNINLSYFCMMIPEHLVDFVILHELCHTKEMNHGPHFWALLDKITNNRAKELTIELKKFKLKW